MVAGGAAEEGYDLVARIGPLAHSGLMFRRIATLPRMLAARPRFLAVQPERRVPGDLHRVPALAIRRDQIQWDLSHGDGSKANIHLRIDFAANRQAILVDAAIAGLGVASLPTFMIEDALAAGLLARALPGWEPSPVEMNALWQKERITGRAVKAIVDEFVLAFAARGAFPV